MITRKLVLSHNSFIGWKLQSVYFNSPAITTEMTHGIYKRPWHEMGPRTFKKRSCTAHMDPHLCNVTLQTIYNLVDPSGYMKTTSVQTSSQVPALAPSTLCIWHRAIANGVTQTGYWAWGMDRNRSASVPQRAGELGWSQQPQQSNSAEPPFPPARFSWDYQAISKWWKEATARYSFP